MILLHVFSSELGASKAFDKHICHDFTDKVYCVDTVGLLGQHNISHKASIIPSNVCLHSSSYTKHAQVKTAMTFAYNLTRLVKEPDNCSTERFLELH